MANHLKNETSPYLLQHAENPVDWYPWGDEAFAKAAAEDKPVLVSIGYSACHWCHVMEHESFSDKETARVMNENFVNIKVDMEERPDIDQIYMAFVQMTTGRGGWPMNVFVTPEKVPFYGGTYFPPEPRYGMPGFKQILQSIRDAYDKNRDDLARSAQEMLDELRRMTAANEPPQSFDHDTLDRAFGRIASAFDAANGGFGGAPKFPPSMTLEFILRYWHRTGDTAALKIAEHTARKMAFGGIYDQLGGGFHRYAVDAVWLVPHFEKMLYDNAQLIRIYTHLYQATNDGLFRRIAEETIDYAIREMLDPAGGFYSSQDADSEGVEGKFFVWTPEEIAAVVGSDADAFAAYYDVTEEGNFEEKNILNIAEYDAEQHEKLAAARKALFDEREKRIKPFRDEKILTAWNGLMLSALAEAATVLDREDYLNIAIKNADFLLAELRPDGRLLRTWKDGIAKLDAYLEDHANLADGLIEIYQATGDTKYLAAGKELAEAMIVEFWDEDGGGFFFTSHGHEQLPVRTKDHFDNATPSGNSAAADVLLRLEKFTGDERFGRFARATLRLAAVQAARYPSGFGRTLSAMEFALAPVREYAVIGTRDAEVWKKLWPEYRPFKVAALSADPNTDAGTVSLLGDKKMIDGRPTIYTCENFVCERPAFDI